MATTAHGQDGGFDLTVSVTRADLLPGTLVDGTLRIQSHDAREIRGARVSLVGVETWRHDVTTTDAQGHTQTETKTSTKELQRVPVQLLGPTAFASGEGRELPFQLPVPSLGPASFDGTELRVTWEARVNLDVPGFDPDLALPLMLHQPTALLRAGVIDLGQFALFEDVTVEADGVRASIHLDPAPLVMGAPFHGRVTMEMAAGRRLQEIRVELRVTAASTVAGGRSESIVVGAVTVGTEGDYAAGSTSYPFEGTLPARALPTTRTEHGRADGELHVILATAWAPDPHLVRDVAICTTTEL